jgi:SAM-dependent methyltransferase
MSRKHWERHAGEWAAWARTPRFDAYSWYSPAFFELVPQPARLTLEVGCGEGRVTRDLTRRGHRTIAVDGSETLIRLAREADPGGTYLVSDAAALPFADESFSLVVLYNVLMDVDDMEGAVREAARVLRPGGGMGACVTHPIPDAGSFESRDADAVFRIEGTYLGPRREFEGAIERDGLKMDFSGWSYPLEAYFRALERAGLEVQAVREPQASPGDPAADERWRRIPMFLMWRAVKPA